MIMRSAIIAAGCAAALMAAPSAGHAQSYADRGVTIVIPVGPGGSFHLYCQILSRHLGRHLPGAPTIVTQNQPGGGGAKAARFMHVAAPKDGTVIAMINPGSLTVPLFRDDAGFDPREMQWLGSMSTRAYTLGVWHTVPAKTLEDLKTVEAVMGASGKSATTYQIPAFVNAALGTKIKMVLGYTGGGEINLALERGEITGRANYYSGYLSTNPEWIAEKRITFLATLGPRTAALHDVPRLSELLVTDEHRQMLSILELAFNVGQGFYAPPDVDTERLALLRAAFVATMKDPAMVAEAAKHRLPLNWLDHGAVEAAIAETYRAPPDTAAKLSAMLGIGN